MNFSGCVLPCWHLWARSAGFITVPGPGSRITWWQVWGRGLLPVCVHVKPIIFEQALMELGAWKQLSAEGNVTKIPCILKHFQTVGLMIKDQQKTCWPLESQGLILSKCGHSTKWIGCHTPAYWINAPPNHMLASIDSHTHRALLISFWYLTWRNCWNIYLQSFTQQCKYSSYKIYATCAVPIQIQWNIIRPWKKKGNPAIWDNTDEHEGCYTIWNKTEKDKSCTSIIYMQT